MNALLIGRSDSLAWALPSLLVRAGFVVDAITSNSCLKYSKFIRNCTVVHRDQSLLCEIVRHLKQQYDWIIITEDGVLEEVLNSKLSLEEKLKILPVQRVENFCHLYSKIGLSKVLAAAGVNTPPFAIAHNREEALVKAEQLGYPVLLKQDSSGGGCGVVECETPSEIHPFHTPLLVQKKISGIELDLSAVYLEGELVHFGYAKIEKTSRRFGPSCLRTYRPLSTLGPEIFRELAHIGKALGAHGFTNTTCIQDLQGRRFYFEVDMRPNVWVAAPRFFGEDPAVRIREWRLGHKALTYPVMPKQPSEILIPYFLRIKRYELLLGRYRVWQFIPWDDFKLVSLLIFRRFLSFGLRGAIKRIFRLQR